MGPPPRFTAVLGGALLVAGLMFAAPFLIVPGAGLTVLALLLPLLVRAQAVGVRVARTESPARIEEGADFELEVRVAGGVLPARAELRDGAARGAERVRIGGSRREVVVRLAGAPFSRGRHRIGAPSVVLSDPLGLTERVVEGSGADSILVVPRVEPVVVPPGSTGGSLGETLAGEGALGGGRSRTAPADPDLEGLRPHLDGSPASRIYWPALARTGELLERRFASRGGGGPVIVLDAGGAPPAEALDRAVRAAASLVFELARVGACELALPARPVPISVGPALAGWQAALVALATVEPVGADDVPHHPRGSQVLWVSASGSGPPPGCHGYLVSASPAPGLRIEFSVAGCHGQALGAIAAPPSRRVAA